MKKQHRFKLLITSILSVLILAACGNNGGIYSDEDKYFVK
ncbi:Oligopeptide ABC transporter, periplasmic oligopeptide-binding protein OppA [Staphylococcus pseudintermedius]|nr:Oligopeptide ABC transporter, periplasmic oligopeptide-binding protein OppA [Staphylococcus pseudintermedius]